jgi:Holliday junction resolvase RusA-like endonuclease
MVAYREAIQWAIRGTRSPGLARQPTTDLLAVSIVFHTNRGDLDNLAKAILDAGNGLAWEDDRQIVELHLYRRRLKAGAKRDPIRLIAETVPGPEIPFDLR